MNPSIRWRIESPTWRRGFALVLLAAAVYAVTSIPHLLAYLRTPPGTTFSGVVIWQEDQDSYFSFIRQAADGHFLFINRLTHREHQPVFINLEWYFVGRVMAWFDGSTNIAYQVWRAAAALAVVFGFFALARIVLRDAVQRWLALFLCVFGGAFQTVFVAWNWINQTAQRMFGWHPRFVSTEFHYFSTHPFAQLLCNPHFALPLGVFMLALAAFLEGEVTSRWRWYGIAGVLAAIEGWMRPYEMIVLYGLIPSFILVEWIVERRWEWRKTMRRLSPLWIAAPVLLFNAYIFEVHPIFKYWASQGASPPISFLDTLAHMGLAGVILIVRLCSLKWFPLSRPAERFVLCWMLMVMFVIQGRSLPWLEFMPYSPQLITSLMPSVILLGVPVFDRVRWPRAFQRPAAWGAVLASVIVLDALDDIRLLRSLTPAGAPTEREAYTPTTEMEAYAWLDREAAENDVVLCLDATGHRLAKYASVRVVAGHWSVTPESQEMVANVRSFYRGTMSTEEAARFLKECRVSWIYYGRKERRLGALRPELVAGFTEHVVDPELRVYSLDH